MSGIGEAQQNMRNFGLAAQAPAQPDLSQYQARGMEALAAGFENLGATMFRIEERKAEAKNYVDVTEADTAMMKLRGDFDKWKLQNPNPAGWEAKWNSLSTDFANTYLSGKEISPKAREQITARMSAFTTREAISVGIDSVKGQVQMAQSAVMANIERAIDQGNLNGVKENVDIAQDQGWMYELQATQIMLDAKDKITAKEIDRVKTVNSRLTYEGNHDLAIRNIQGLADQGYVTQDEANELKISVENDRRYKFLIEEVRNDSVENQDETLAKLQQVDKSGDFVHYKGMAAADRANAVARIKSAKAEENLATIDAVISENRTIKQVANDPRFNAFSDQDKRLVLDRLQNEALNRHLEWESWKDNVKSVDSGTDEGREELYSLQKEAFKRFDGEYLEESKQLINDKLENPAPPQPSDRAVSSVFNFEKQRFDAEEYGTYSYSKDQIIKDNIIDENGIKTDEIGYFVEDSNPPEGFGYATQKWIFWGPMILPFGSGYQKVGPNYKGPKRRKITLSRDQQRDFEAGNKTVDYIDQIFYQDAGLAFSTAVENIQRRLDAGEFKDSAELSAAFREALGVSDERSAENLLLMPPQIMPPVTPGETPDTTFMGPAGNEMNIPGNIDDNGVESSLFPPAPGDIDYDPFKAIR